VARVLALIDDHCAGDIGMADLLRAAGVSARTLQYAFVQRFGVGPITYLKQTRLRRIQQDLLGARDDHNTVGDVAAKWGYYNGSVFARAYHKLFGELPSQTLASRKRPA
jgi:AraC family ethanolamine operon transcriptional activator